VLGETFNNFDEIASIGHSVEIVALLDRKFGPPVSCRNFVYPTYKPNHPDYRQWTSIQRAKKNRGDKRGNQHHSDFSPVSPSSIERLRVGSQTKANPKTPFASIKKPKGEKTKANGTISSKALFPFAGQSGLTQRWIRAEQIFLPAIFARFLRLHGSVALFGRCITSSDVPNNSYTANIKTNPNPKVRNVP